MLALAAAIPTFLIVGFDFLSKIMEKYPLIFGVICIFGLLTLWFSEHRNQRKYKD